MPKHQQTNRERAEGSLPGLFPRKLAEQVAEFFTHSPELPAEETALGCHPNAIPFAEEDLALGRSVIASAIQDAHARLLKARTVQSVVVDVVDTYTRYDFEKALYERCKEVIKYFEDLDHRSHIDTRAEEMTAGNVDGLEALVYILHSTIHNGEPEATQTTPAPFTPTMRSVIVDAIALMPLGTAIRAQWVAKAHEVLAQPQTPAPPNDTCNMKTTEDGKVWRCVLPFDHSGDCSQVAPSPRLSIAEAAASAATLIRDNYHLVMTPHRKNAAHLPMAQVHSVLTELIRDGITPALTDNK